MQGDGNFVLYKIGGGALWSSQTAGKGIGPYILRLEGTNNLVMYDKDSTTIWQSGSAIDHADSSSGYVRMRSNGALVIMRGDDTQLWRSNTKDGKVSDVMGTGKLLISKILSFYITNLKNNIIVKIFSTFQF